MGRYMLCCFLMITLYPVGIDLYLVALPNIGASLQASEAQLHTAFSLYLLGMAATVPLAGLLADRHGRRPVILSGPACLCWRRYWPAAPPTLRSFCWHGSARGRGRRALHHDLYRAARRVATGSAGGRAVGHQWVICVIPVLAPLLGYLILTGFPWPAIFQAMALLGGLVLLINLLG
ncbi:MFS transporter [Aeromonas hydrophila]|nr:MFS transporter [Aeromonas hydrophila]